MARPREISDEQILETTRDLVLEHGAGVATGKIAKALGVSAAALFHRFKTKRALLLAAMLPKELGTLSMPVDDRPVAEQLADFARVAMPLSDQMARTMVVFLHGPIPVEEFMRHTGGPPLVKLARPLMLWVMEMRMRGRIGSVDPEAFARGFIGALNMKTIESRMMGQELSQGSIDTYLRNVVDLYARALRPD